MSDAVLNNLLTVGFYTALNMFILFWIGNATGILRRRHRIAVGDNGNSEIERTMRGHANAVENMPMTMIMLAIAALVGAPAIAIHLLGVTFTIGRALHAWHFIQPKAPWWQRFVGFGMAAVVSLALALGLITHWFAGLFGT